MTSRAFLRSRRFVIGLAAMLAAGIAAGGWYLLVPGAGSGAGSTALVGGPFELTDQQGEPVSDRDFAGRFMLIYFGYTFCPDFCPMSLSTMTRALDLLPAAQAERVVPIFISIDPARDTVEQLAEYAPLFHPRLVALTGSAEAVKEAAKAYRVYYSRAGIDDGDDYLMDHSTFIYLMGPEGAYLRHFGHNASAEEVAEALEAALAAG